MFKEKLYVLGILGYVPLVKEPILVKRSSLKIYLRCLYHICNLGLSTKPHHQNFKNYLVTIVQIDNYLIFDFLFMQN